MTDLPTGTITFVFTDVQGSTRRWEADPDGMRVAMAQHDAIAQAIVERHEGTLVRSRGEGDSLFLVFDRATNAVSAALALQLAFADHAWPVADPIRVRMAIGTSEATLRDHDYYGSNVNRFARLRSVGHAGQVLLSQTTRELVCDALPSGLSLLDLGDHQLADLTRPERVYQLTGGGLTVDFPPLKSLNVLPNNLPRQTTTFIGREKEVADIRKLLAESALVTVMGSGGVGKSRICFQVAADLIPQFPDGVWASELAAVTGDEQTQARIASSINAGGGDPVESLVATIKTKKMLLVIDNCEHVIDGVRVLAAAVLQRCPNARILATSRERLDVPGEKVYRLPSLGVPDPAHLPPLHDLTEFDAIRLFVQRAQQLDSAFEVTDANAAAVAGICSRLDGIPLAIELAASRTKVLPPAEILKRLNQQFKLLTGGSRLALPRQQTLLATIEWGYDLLTDSEKTVLQRLSVFVDGWTMEAAEQVCSGDDIEEWEVLDLMTSLIDKSMVLPYDDRYGGQRYRLLESVRQFAEEKLDTGGQTLALRERHATYFEGIAKELEESEIAARGLPRKDSDQTRVVESANFLAAIDYLCEEGNSADADRVCAVYCQWAGGVQSWSRQWTDVFKRIRICLPLMPTSACAKALTFYAGNLSVSGESPSAYRSVAEEALSLARQANDMVGQFGALQTLARALEKTGREDEADACRLEAEGIANLLQWPKFQNTALDFKGNRHFLHGEYHPALDCYLELAQLGIDLGDAYGDPYYLTNAGRIAYMLGEYRQAGVIFENAAASFAISDLNPGLLLRHRADLNRAVGRFDDAWADLSASHEQVMTHNMPVFLAVDFESAAYLHASESEFAAAAHLLGSANARRVIAEAPRVIPEQQEYDKIRALIVAGIGEAECARLIAEGEKLTDEQANALVVRMAATGAEAPVAFDDV